MSMQPPLGGACNTVDALLRAAADTFPARDAVVEPDGVRMSYAEWDQRSEALAGALGDRGVRPGDVVALLLPSSIDFAVCYAAIARCGAVTTALNTRLGPREVDQILSRALPTLVIRDRDAGVADVPLGTRVLERSELATLYRHPGLGSLRPLAAPDAAVVIIWTSGTTGSPKGAWFDTHNLIAGARSAGVMSAAGDRRLVATPFAHAGYMFKLWDQIAWGVTVVISQVPWTAASMAQVMREERISVVGAVPTQWAKLLELEELPTFPDLRIGICATAPAPPDLVEAVVSRLGIPLVVRYALTESPTVCGTSPDDPPDVQSRTVGKPQAGMQVTVADGAGTTVAPGALGRVRVRGRCVMRGYWRDPQRTAESLSADGWLLTGDIGFTTVDGDLVLAGRDSDVYNRGGYKVHPVEVENVLAEHRAVRRCAVVGAPAHIIGEIGVAFVIPADPDRPPLLNVLREWVRSRLADYKAPDRLVLVDDIPVTSMLKTDRTALRRMAAAVDRDTAEN
jgi:acyl-CoA synthetase (AMP-forming)/AMP-acid ligase II